MRKKLLTLAVATVAASSLLTGCGGSSSNDKKAASDENITAVSREDGSGTRGAFIELFGIEQKDKDGNKVDKTTSSVQITKLNICHDDNSCRKQSSHRIHIFRIFK